MKTDETLKKGLDAHARIQKAIRAIERLLQTIEPTDRDSYQAEMVRSGKEKIGRAIEDMVYSLDAVRDVLIDQDDNTRSITAAYRESWHALPNIYRQAVQDTLTRMHGNMDEKSAEALNLTIEVLSDGDANKRAAFCEHLRDFFVEW